MGKTTIETLQVEVQDESLQAANGLEKLKNTLSQLKIMARGGIGLTSVIHQLEKLDTSAKKINGDGVRKLQTLTTALNALSSVGKPNISKSTANQIEAIGKATKSLSGIDFTLLRNLADSLKPLEGLQKTNLGNTVNNLKKVPEALSGIRNVGQADTDAIKRLVETLKPLSEMGSISNFASALNKLRQLPEIAKSLEGMDMTRFEQQIIRVTNAVRPLATEMDKIARGFSSFPERIQRVITGMEKLESKSNTVSGAMSKFYSSLRSMRSTFTTLYFSISRITDKLGEWFNESAEYVEALNLFNVTMRDGTDAAFEYAESVSNLMGIDIKEWMNYQGSFQNLVTGYEVSTGKARVMSKGLTQLAYDLSSVYNVSVETAFTKLQSAMSGQVKSLKVWGVDVSVASMKQYMLAKGITASWLSLNTAQKAILRYNYIMEKTVNMQGDLARTLVTPSNAMRIFKAQCVQLWRALGNIVSILATKVIPYMQAFVEEATDAANELAILWGFELPKIDYSGLDSTGVTENLEETEDALTSLKRSFIGMDEINALNGNAAASSSLLPENLGMSIYDYDFLSNSVKVTDEIKKKVKGFVDDIKNAVVFIHDHGKQILDLVLILVAIKVGTDLFNLFSAFVSVVKVIGSVGANVIQAAMLSFTTAFEATGSIGSGVAQIFKDCWKNLKNFYNSIPTAVKHLVGAAGLAAGFVLCKNGAYDLAKAIGSNSNEGLGKSIISLVAGGASAIIGGAMIGGPVGAVAGAFVALTGVIIGVAKAEAELRAEFVKTQFINDTGVKLNELASYYQKVWGETDTLASKTESAKNTIKQCAEDIGNARRDIQPFLDKIIETGVVTDEESTQMSEYVTTMVDSLKYQMNTRVDSILATFKSLIGLARIDFEKEIDSMSSDFLEFKALFGDVTDSYQSKIQAILDKATKKDEQGNYIGLDDAARQELQNNVNKLSSLDITVSTEKSNFDDFISAASSGLSISSVEDATSILNELSQKTSAYKESLGTAYENTLAQIKTLSAQNEALYKEGDISESEYKRFAETFSSAQTTLKDAYTSALSQMIIDAEKVAQAVQIGAINNIPGLVDASKQDYANANWFDKNLNVFSKYYDGEEELVVGDMRIVNRDIIEPIAEAVNTLLQSIGSSQTAWAADAMAEIIENFFSTWMSYSDLFGSDLHYEYATSIEDALKQALHDAGVPGYATGGFPEDGLFMANSRELVGKFTNGKTAVANNNQIIEGIKQGVKEANSESGAVGGDWIIQLVDTDGSLKSETIITAAERKNRRDGKTIIPVGT